MRYKLKKSEILEMLEKSLSTGTRIVAPQEKDGKTNFHVIKKVNDISWDAYTQMSAKEFIFPRYEPLMSFEMLEDSLKIIDVEPKADQTIIFGTRPCDAAAFLALDHVFKWDYDDKFYWKRRNATTLISFACINPLDECFCTSVGLSPFSEKGSDALITPISEELFLFEIFTEKGKKLVNLLEKKETLEKNETVEKAVSNLKPKTDLNSVFTILKDKFNKDELWESLTMSCIGCGACAMVCPTCYCFDIVDEGDSRGGVRLKNWDACSFSLFTKHGGGHNPRNKQFKRCRQRYMHKFLYFRDKFGENLCVGCGRCTRVCPVSLDIYSIMEAVKRD